MAFLATLGFIAAVILVGRALFSVDDWKNSR